MSALTPAYNLPTTCQQPLPDPPNSTADFYAFSVSEPDHLVPYQQGQLDGHCGIYSLVNTVHYLCGPLRTHQATKLFTQLLEAMTNRLRSYGHVEDGIYLKDLAWLLKYHIAPNYPINRHKPFNKNSHIKSPAYWTTSRDLLAQHQQSIILTGIGGVHDHWTLITRITDKRVWLFDSDRLHYLPMDHCCTNGDAVEKRHILYPSNTYFLWVDEPGESL